MLVQDSNCHLCNGNHAIFQSNELLKKCSFVVVQKITSLLQIDKIKVDHFKIPKHIALADITLTA